ncbi:hypothetical protein BASA82_001016 [Batrachochytrium salamandrivorans]|nr:hypothetical protein BASA60_009791 [Batrachochytrium salamandrivorans]KAH6572325.1 hypothetical protein BASA62_003474 [Batrachochytrium salamandrivorans]KAH9261358.1 hypothetical protein BASA82_001016 [Batrachochytrium salamandrivorans]KAH9273713.1 hypothetical protein BASA83_004047 [Batrachochytrium salamandrivorans]
MRLSSFAAVSLLAITVSAQPPHNPDTDDMDKYLHDAIQEMDQSQNDAIREIEKLQGISDHDVQVLMALFSQDPQQFPEFDTQMPDQPQGSDIQNMDQFLDAATQSAQQPQESDVQDVQKILDDAILSEQQHQGISAQDLHEILNGATQNTQSSQDAATQSVQQNQGATFPDIQQLPDAAAPSAEKLDRNKAQIEMDRLTEAFKMQDRRCSEIDRQIRADKQRDKKVRDIIDNATIKLQETGLSSSETLRLQQKIYDFRIVLDQLVVRHKRQHRSYEDAMTERHDANVEIKLFKENQEIIAAYNSKNEVKVELSPDSCYNMEILTAQYNKVLKDIDALFAKQKAIDNLLLSSNDDALKTQSAQLADKIRILENYNGAAREILWQHEHGQSIDEWISKSLDSYMQNTRVE